MKDLANRVVVITGASSGLGREAALQFARRGSIVIAAARRDEALDETVRLCVATGGTAYACVTDVTREEDVESLARFAASKTGSIDVWVNNAGVTLFGPLESGPFEDHRRVIETNLFGAIFGARAVVPIFRRQGYGVLINIGSILSKIGQPFVPSYVISKFGLHGLSEALRAELADCPDIHVCSLFPYATPTQHFEAGANRTGRDPHVMPPVQPPEKVAAAIVDLARRPRRSRHVPRIAVLGLMLHTIAPNTVERLLRDALDKWHFGDTPIAPTRGNLYQPHGEGGAVHGERPPRIGTAGLLVWAFGHLLTLQAESLRRLFFGAPRAQRKRDMLATPIQRDLPAAASQS